MFDTIKYEYVHALETNDEIKKLVPNVESLEFQTKDLDNCLNTYYITKEGRLLYKNVKHRWVDDDNAFLKGYLDEVSHTLDDMQYHGDLLFYSYDFFDQKDGTQLSMFLDYKARFTDGKLQEVKLEKYRIEDSTDRKKKMDEFYEECAKSNKLFYNKYLFNTKFYNISVRRPILWFFRQLNNLTQNTYYFISRHL